jgi:hypothetical protein
MESNVEKQGADRKYEKPQTKKHDAINTVQGSVLYGGGGSYYYTTLYRVRLYYYY